MNSDQLIILSFGLAIMVILLLIFVIPSFFLYKYVVPKMWDSPNGRRIIVIIAVLYILNLMLQVLNQFN